MNAFDYQNALRYRYCGLKRFSVALLSFCMWNAKITCYVQMLLNFQMILQGHFGHKDTPVFSKIIKE